MKTVATIFFFFIALIPVLALPNLTERAPEVWDDADLARIKYGGPTANWVHPNSQGSTVWAGTESYDGARSGTAEISFYRNPNRNVLRVYATKKAVSCRSS